MSVCLQFCSSTLNVTIFEKKKKNSINIVICVETGRPMLSVIVSSQRMKEHQSSINMSETHTQISSSRSV